MKLTIDTSPLEYAKSLTKKELQKLIKDCKKGEYDEYTDRCRVCFEKYLAGDLVAARWWSHHADLVK